MTTKLQLLITGRTDGTAEAALDKTGQNVEKTTSKFDKFNSAMGKAALPAAAVVGGLAAIGKASFDSASALEQNTGAVEAVFGAHANVVKAQADVAAQNVGLAKSEYSELSALLGSQLVNMGTSQEELAGKTQDLVGLGADLAAQFGGSTSDAVAALSSLLRGERNPIERYGVSINAAAVEAQKAKMGLAGLTGEADKNATTQATLALLTQQTASAQGAFARESETAAGQQQRMAAELENAKASLGEALLPVVSQAAQLFAGLARAAGENADILGPLALVVGGLAAAILVYNGVMGALPAIQAVATAAQWLWNAAMMANPVTWIVIGIIALIAIIVVLIKNWDKVKEVAVKVFDQVKAAIGEAAGWLKSQWDTAINSVVRFWDNFTSNIRNGIDSIIGWFLSIPNKISNVFSSIQLPGWVTQLGSIVGFDATATATLVASPGIVTGFDTVGPRATFGSSWPVSSPTVINNITVNGALDPRGVARQIRSLINYDARIRGVTDLSGNVIA